MPELTGKLAKEISQIQEKASLINKPTESKCLACGADVRSDDRFCKRCGTPIVN
jgi:predicted amidophosphoribosyltransferase